MKIIINSLINVLQYYFISSSPKYLKVIKVLRWGDKKAQSHLQLLHYSICISPDNFLFTAIVLVLVIVSQGIWDSGKVACLSGVQWQLRQSAWIFEEQSLWQREPPPPPLLLYAHSPLSHLLKGMIDLSSHRNSLLSASDSGWESRTSSSVL